MMTMREKKDRESAMQDEPAENHASDFPTYKQEEQGEADKLVERKSAFAAQEAADREQAVENATADLTAEELIRVARIRLDAEHEEVGNRIVELEAELKKLHERDGILVDMINRLIDATEGPPENEVDDDDPAVMAARKLYEKDEEDSILLNYMISEMNGRGRTKASTLTDLLRNHDDLEGLNRQKVQQILQRHKDDVFSYTKDGWKLK